MNFYYLLNAYKQTNFHCKTGISTDNHYFITGNNPLSIILSNKINNLLNSIMFNMLLVLLYYNIINDIQFGYGKSGDFYEEGYFISFTNKNYEFIIWILMIITFQIAVVKQNKIIVNWFYYSINYLFISK
jgi:hypothetical protein